MARLAAAGIQVTPGRVADLTLAGTRYDTMKAALDIMLAAPEFDLVVAVVGSSARMHPHLAVKPIIDSAGSAKPLAAMIVPEAPQAIAQLTAAHVPCFRTPEACADVIAAVFARRSPLGLAAVADAPAPIARRRPVPLSEAQAYRLLDRLGVPHAPFVTAAIDGDSARAIAVRLPGGGEGLLGRHSPQDRGRRRGARRGRSRRPAARPVQLARQPVAARARHRGQRGADPADDRRAWPRCWSATRSMRRPVPSCMLAAGGIWAEVARDRSIRLAPVSVAVAHEMIDEVRALQTVSGLRGRPRGDLDALARAISALSQLAVQPGGAVLEAEINPMMVMAEGHGVLAVDALVLTR